MDVNMCGEFVMYKLLIAWTIALAFGYAAVTPARASIWDYFYTAERPTSTEPLADLIEMFRTEGVDKVFYSEGHGLEVNLVAMDQILAGALRGGPFSYW